MNKSITIRTLIFWAVFFGLVLFFMDSCKRGFRGGIFGGSTDTVSVVHDTTWVLVQGDSVYVPQVHTIIQTNTIYKPLYRTDTLEISEVAPTDTAAILARFYEQVVYIDTISKKDTTLSKYGTITVIDTVLKNRIKGRHLINNLKIPEVTNTVTLVKNKPVLYMGASVMGTPTAPIYAVGGDLSLKSVNGKIYTVGAMSTKTGAMYYVAGLKVPVRLRKSKN